ncbi:MAG: DUF268 domain-containing protein [Selenomonadaceae bacterium]|nr:DUF268 domain-containing protein [Selenomonadaceae bacterium]
MGYVLFGAGYYGKLMLKILDKKDIVCFCDNRVKEENKMKIDGIPVIPYKVLKNNYLGHNVVITTREPQNIMEISKQLNKDNIPFTFIDEIAHMKLQDDIETYRRLNNRPSFQYDESRALFFPLDKYQPAGSVGGYFWQDIWGAQHVFEKKPAIHYDIGSRIDGFIAHLLSFGQSVRLLDIRPLDVFVPGMEFIQCDATNMEAVDDESIESLSALCSLEHFGLGRFGDPIDPEACFKCFSAIPRKMKKGGNVYISVPIGKEHVEFHAHRVFYASTIINNFKGMDLVEYSAIHEDGVEKFIDNIHKYDEYGESMGVMGLFHFFKK